MTYEEWKRKVDEAISDMTYGMVDSRDLADQPYYDWYESEMTPEEAAVETLENEGYPFED